MKTTELSCLSEVFLDVVLFRLTASSAERFALYVNCSEEVRWKLVMDLRSDSTSPFRHFITTDVRATGMMSFRPAILSLFEIKMGT